MAGRIEETLVTFMGQTPPVDESEALAILEHIEAYDPPEPYTNRVSNIDGLEADAVERGFLFFGDGVPTTFDVQQVKPHAFHAEYDDGRVSVDFRTDLDHLADFLDAIEHVLELTTLQVGLEAHNRQNFDVQFRTNYLVDVRDIETPTGWMVQARTNEERGQSIVRLTLLGEPVLEDSTAPITDEIADARSVSDQLDETLDVGPAMDSPTSTVEEFYRMDANPAVDSDREVRSFFEAMAHGDGLYAHLEEFDVQDDTNLLTLDTAVVDDPLDEAAVAEWLADRPVASQFIDGENIEALAAGGVTVVEATAEMEIDGQRQTERKEHMVAREDGDWKLVR